MILNKGSNMKCIYIYYYLHQLWSSENLLHVKPAALKNRTFDLTPGTSAAPHPVAIEPRRPMSLERQGAKLFCHHIMVYVLYCAHITGSHPFSWGHPCLSCGTFQYLPFLLRPLRITLEVISDHLIFPTKGKAHVIHTM